MKPMKAVREDEALRHTRFMLITGSDNPAIAAEAQALGADAFLVKPFHMHTLREKIEAMFAGPDSKAA